MRRAVPTSFPDVLDEIVADAGPLSLHEMGAYLHLVRHQCRTRRALPDDAEALAAIVGCTLAEWAELARRVLGPFSRTATGWVHPRLATVIARLERVAASRSAAAQRAALARHHPHGVPAWKQAQEGKPEDAAPYLPGFEPDEAPPVRHARSPDVGASRTENGASRMRDACVTHNTHTHSLGSVPLSNGCSERTQFARARVREGVRARACVREAPAAPPPEALAAVVAAIRAEGVAVLPGDPVLERLVAWGLGAECFAAVVRDACGRSNVADPFRWAMSKCRALVREAQSLDVDDRAAPAPARASPGEPALDDDDRRAQVVGYIAFAEYRTRFRQEMPAADARRLWGEGLRMQASLYYAQRGAEACAGVRP